jgi:aspartyl-tRNA synthetase
MIKYITSLQLETIVDMKGKVTIPNKPIESSTQSMVEIQINSFHCVVKVKVALPFQMEDACSPNHREENETESEYDDYEKQVSVDSEEEEKIFADGRIHVDKDKRLNHRWLDLQTPTNQAIFHIESMVGQFFRECLLKKGFVEIHTPKLIKGASEGAWIRGLHLGLLWATSLPCHESPASQANGSCVFRF